VKINATNNHIINTIKRVQIGNNQIFILKQGNVLLQFIIWVVRQLVLLIYLSYTRQSVVTTNIITLIKHSLYRHPHTPN